MVFNKLQRGGKSNGTLDDFFRADMRQKVKLRLLNKKFKRLQENIKC